MTDDRISRWTGEFSDPAEERQFLKDTHTDRQRRAWLGALLWSAGWVLWTFVDSNSTPGWRLTAIGVARVAAVVPLLMVSLTSKRVGRPFLTQLFAAVMWHGVLYMVVTELVVAKPVWIVWERFIAAVAIGLWVTLTFRQLALTIVLLNVSGLLVVLTHNSIPVEAAIGWLATAVGGCLAPLLLHASVSRILRDRHRGVRKLEAALQSRENLIAAVAHELRIPLAKARMRVALMELDSEPTEHLDAVDGDLNHLNHLISGLVDLGRISTDQERAPHALDGLVTDVVGTLERLSPNCTVELGALLEVSVSANPHLLQTAIRALVSNATDVATTVRVSIEATATEAVVVVDDNGPGVPQADRQRIFDPLIRGSEARDHGDPHLGLGLSTATRIVESHGGQIEVTDSPMGGARFLMRLPLNTRFRS